MIFEKLLMKPGYELNLRMILYNSSLLVPAWTFRCLLLLSEIASVSAEAPGLKSADLGVTVFMYQDCWEAKPECSYKPISSMAWENKTQSLCVREGNVPSVPCIPGEASVKTGILILIWQHSTKTTCIPFQPPPPKRFLSKIILAYYYYYSPLAIK